MSDASSTVPVSFTVFQAIERQSKVFSRQGDQIKKDVSQQMYQGAAIRWNGDFAELPALLMKLTPEHSIGMGVFDPAVCGGKPTVRIVKKGLEEPDAGVISRTKTFFPDFPDGPALIMFDHDTHERCKQIQPGDLPGILAKYVPGADKAAYITRGSSSASIFLAEEPADAKKESKSFHGYFAVKNGRKLHHFVDILFKRFVLDGWGYAFVAADGRITVRTIIDMAPLKNTCGIIFEGAPAIEGEGLEYRPQTPAYTPGDYLDIEAICELSEDEEARYEQVKEEITHAPDVLAESRSKRETWAKEQEGKALKKGLPPERAKKLRAMLVASDKQDLPSDYVLEMADGSTLTVGELLVKHEQYDDMDMPDPIEPEKGRNKAKFYWNDGKKPIIKSFSRGGTIYHLHGADNDYMTRLNAKHAVVMLGGKCVVLNEVTIPEFNNRPDITFSSTADFCTYYANEFVQTETKKGETKAVSIASLWLKDKARRQYEGICMCPGRTVPGYYNLYRGWAVEPKPGKWDRFRGLIHDVICSGNDEHSSYLINWMSYIVQNIQNGSGERPEVAVVMRGDRGTGKGTFARVGFGSLFGGHFLQANHAKHFTGAFNQHLKDCLLLFADEAFFAGDKQAEGVIKGLITEPTIRIEPKNINSFEVRNHVSLIMASNNDWIIPAGIDERRFFVVEVSNAHKQDHAYFAAIKEELDHGGREAMLYDLLHRDLTGVNIRAVPQTEALAEQKLLSADSVAKWWYSRLYEGDQLTNGNGWKDMVPTEYLYRCYTETAKTLGFGFPDTIEGFSKKIRKMCTKVKGPYRPRINGVRVNALGFPDLNECRKQFEVYLGHPIGWPGAATP